MAACWSRTTTETKIEPETEIKMAVVLSQKTRTIWQNQK